MGWSSENLDLAVAADRDYGWQCKCGALYRDKVEFCLECGEFKTVWPRRRREADRLLPSIRGLTANQLAALDQKSLPLGPYTGLKFAPGSLIALAGQAGSGKSTMALRIAAAVRPSVYLSFEEGLNEGFASKLRRLEIRHSDLYVEVPSTVYEMVEVIRERSPRSVIIDSIQVTSLLPKDARSLASMIGGLVVAVSQINRQGDMSGTAAWDHEVDVLLRLDSMRWKATKNRFGELSEGEVLQ
jgi:predicted ATP-dependent serine protease